MSGFTSLSQALAAVGGSGYRGARVLRFIHRHPDSHRAIIGQLRRRTQRRQRRAAQRFARMKGVKA